MPQWTSTRAKQVVDREFRVPRLIVHFLPCVQQTTLLQCKVRDDPDRRYRAHILIQTHPQTQYWASHGRSSSPESPPEGRRVPDGFGQVALRAQATIALVNAHSHAKNLKYRGAYPQTVAMGG
jgi:hypothetical protein